jgi:glycosyltransferase involved in cell wall biosynthesis
MRICRLTLGFPTGKELTFGLGPTFYHISKEQAALGLNVHVITRKRTYNTACTEIDGIKVHYVNSPYNFNAIRKIFELHKKLRLDVIHAHATCGLAYPIFRKGISVPLIVHVHGTTLGSKKYNLQLPTSLSLKYFLKSKFRQGMSVMREIFLWRHADLLIAVSQAQKEELKALYGIGNEKIRVVYLGVDPTVFRHYNDISFLRDRLKLVNKRVILFVGHFGLRKGIPFLIKAMPQILREHPNVVLLCVGGTPKWLGTRLYWDYLENMIREVSIGKNVRLVGEVPHHELPYYYSMADVFAFPTLYEAFGKVIVEAMACEAPVVASKVGGIPEIIEHKCNGLLIEPGNVDELAYAINSLLSDSEFAERLGEKARQTVIEKFTWRHTAENLTKIYSELMR